MPEATGNAIGMSSVQLAEGFEYSGMSEGLSGAPRPMCWMLPA